MLRLRPGLTHDLAAVVDNSPVGVVVFDVQNGQVVSSNTESRRIVGGICTPGRLIAQLLDA